MADQDIGFTFDTTPFTKGINKVLGGMNKMETSATNVAKGVSRGFNRIIAKIGIAAGAFFSLRTAINNMPEIGKAFGIAKDTILKNLLFPIRKQLMPLLQGLLDWTRDNRTLFVKWGQAIAGVLKSAINGFKQFLGFMKRVGGGALDFINRIFDSSIGSFSELINVAIFKIATAVEFFKALMAPLGELLGPLVDQFVDILVPTVQSLASILGKVAEFAVRIGTAFLEGWLEGVQGIEGPITKIWDAIKGILDALFTGEGPLEFWSKTFEGIGKIVGTVLVGAFETIGLVLQGIEFVIRKIIEFFNSEAFQAVWNHLFAPREDDKSRMTGGVNVGGEGLGTLSREGRIGELREGNINNTSNNTDNSINMNVTVNANGMPEGMAEQTGSEIMDALRRKLNEERERTGR